MHLLSQANDQFMDPGGESMYASATETFFTGSHLSSVSAMHEPFAQNSMAPSSRSPQPSQLMDVNLSSPPPEPQSEPGSTSSASLLPPPPSWIGAEVTQSIQPSLSPAPAPSTSHRPQIPQFEVQDLPPSNWHTPQLMDHGEIGPGSYQESSAAAYSISVGAPVLVVGPHLSQARLMSFTSPIFM